MKISPHFTLAELTFSETARRRGIDNLPDKVEIENLTLLCNEILEPLRSAVKRPVTITSAYRSLYLNRAIGSRDTSQHILGLAADLRIHGYSPLEVCEKILSLGLPFDQLIHEFGGWTHVSIPPNGSVPRRQTLTIDRLGTRLGLHPAR